MNEPRISAILLAAGLSRRMGGDKLLLPFEGKTLLQRAMDLLTELRVYERVLVTTEARLETLVVPPGMRVAVNYEPEVGQSTSVRLGVSASSGDWFLFMAADQPLLEAYDLTPMLELACGGSFVSCSAKATVQRVSETYHELTSLRARPAIPQGKMPCLGDCGSEAAMTGKGTKQSCAGIIYPRVNGNPCMPALFHASFREELMALTGDMGGRVVREAFPEACVTLSPERPERFVDVDDRESYRALLG